MPSRAAALLGLLLLSGCLRPVEIPPVALSGPSDERTALSDGLGVIPLEDLRPREQKRGKKPWLVPLLIWNQRTGRYVTGSRHFGGDVSSDVSEAIAAALSGWRFGRGRVLPPASGEDAVAEHCAAGDLAYVASGEIHHLYGAVRQRSWLFIIPTPWLAGVLSGNQVGDPVGVVRLSLRIRDCHSGEEIVSRRFVAEGVFPRLSASAAAQRAFDQLMREVADLSRVETGAGDVARDEAHDDEPAPPEPAEPEPETEPEPEAEPAPDPEPPGEGSDGPVLVPL